MDYVIGNKIRITGTITDLEGTAVDPTTLEIEVRDPAGKVTTYTYGEDEEVVRDSTGVYYLDLLPNLPGPWRYYWLGEGENQVASNGSFFVKSKTT